MSDRNLDSNEEEPQKKRRTTDFASAEYVQIKASNAEV